MVTGRQILREISNTLGTRGLIGPEVYRQGPRALSRDRHIAAYRERRIFVSLTTEEQARYDALMENGLTAIKRWGTAKEVAVAVRTLATGGLPFSVGQAIRVDGGLLVSKY